MVLDGLVHWDLIVLQSLVQCWMFIFLHHLMKCGQCLVLEGLNGWWSRMVWCTEAWWFSKVLFNADCLFSCTIWRNVVNAYSPGWFGALFPRPDGIAYSLVECSEWLMEDCCFTGQTHLSKLPGSKALIAPGGRVSHRIKKAIEETNMVFSFIDAAMNCPRTRYSWLLLLGSSILCARPNGSEFRILKMLAPDCSHRMDGAFVDF